MNYPQTPLELGPCTAKRNFDTTAPIDRETRYRVDDLKAHLGVFDSAKVVNISLGGVGIETHNYLQIGKSYPLRFRRPSGLLRLTATVLWSQLTRTTAVNASEVLPVFLAGLEFSDVSDTQKRGLEELIAEALEQVQGGADDAAAAAIA